MDKYPEQFLPTQRIHELLRWFASSMARRFLVLGGVSALLAFTEIYRFSLLPALAEALQGNSGQDPWHLAAVAAGVFCIVHPLLLGLATWLRNEWIQVHTRNKVLLGTFRRALGRSFRDFSESPPGMTSSYVAGYPQTLLAVTRIGYVDSIYFVTTLVAISAYFADLQTILFLPILLWLLLLLIIGGLFYRGAAVESSASLAAQGRWFGAKTETFSNWALVKGAQSEDHEFAAFAEKLQAAVPLELKVQRRMRRLMISVAVANGVTLTLMILFALLAWRDGAIGVEALLFILPVSLKIVSLSEAALGIGNEFFVLLGQVGGAAAFLKFDQPAPDAAKVQNPEDGSAVALRDVEIRVTSDTPLVSDFNLSVQPGEVIALTGPSGVGKSTLIHTMAGLFGVAAGTLAIRHRGGRPSVALCPQKTSVFNRSLRDNICYGSDQSDYNHLLQVTEIAGLMSVVLDLGKGDLAAGLDFEIAPDGVNLSGGQLQRVSIARALFRKPALLLLDEATTGIESTVERQIIADIRAAFPEMAIVIVSHNQDTIALADRSIALAPPVG